MHFSYMMWHFLLINKILRAGVEPATYGSNTPNARTKFVCFSVCVSVALSVPRPRAWKKMCRRPAADECGADACKSQFHGFFSCLLLYKPAHACRCSPQLLNPFTSPVELIRGRRISAASFYRSPGSRTRAFRFVFFVEDRCMHLAGFEPALFSFSHFQVTALPAEPWENVWHVQFFSRVDTYGHLPAL